MSSIIQNIRDKYARIAVIAIALSLLGFILMDALNNRTGGLFNRQPTSLGSVNGVSINAKSFDTRLRMQEEAMRRNNQGSMDALQSANYRESIWNDEVEKALMNAEFEKLGFRVGKKEMNDIIVNNPTDNLQQIQFARDQQTGQYVGQNIQQFIATYRKQNDEFMRYQAEELSNQIEFDRKLEKYKNIMVSAISYPKWFFEKQNADRAAMAKVSYVAVPYDVIKDSLVTVSDADINAYVSKHKKLYKQEESRTLRYVSFNAAPTAADSLNNRDNLAKKISEFAADTNAADYIARNVSALPYADIFVGKNQMQMPSKDSIQRLGKGQVFGPYLDGGNYVLAKMIDLKSTFDTVKVRHILVKTLDPQSGQVTLPDSIGKKRADSILAAVRGGANFDSLVVKYSDDQGSVTKGGVYEFDYATNFMIEFKDFGFNKPVGTKDIVKTAYGYHIMEVLNQKGSQNYYKVAYLAKKIEASDETINAAAANAQSFAASVSNPKAFEDNAKAKGYTILAANNIRPNDFSISAIGGGAHCRSFVRDIYEAKKGAVLSPQDEIGQEYIVGLVSEILEEGTQNAATARPSVELLIRKKKKAEQIKQKIGKVSTLEAVTSLYGGQVQTMDSVRMDGSRPIGNGYEPKLLGAVFNPDNKGKVVPEALSGTNGVYVLRVEDVTATPIENNDPQAQAKQAEAGTRQNMLRPQQQFNFPGMGSQSYEPSDVLRRAATIKDKRATFY